MSRFFLEERHPGTGHTVIEVHGELDLSVADGLRAAISRTSTGRVVIDLLCCEFIDSTGIAVLLLAAREFADEGRTLEVSGVRDQVLRVFEMSGLEPGNGLIKA
jgi:anti-anti-sigma factor